MNAPEVPSPEAMGMGPAEPAPRFTPMTWAIAATITIAFLAQLYLSKVTQSPVLDDAMEFSPHAFLAGEYWRSLSYAWLHAEDFPLHVIVNVWFICIFGAALEEIIGPWLLLVVYLGGCAAGVLPYLTPESIAANTELIGASAAAFALFTATAVLMPKLPLRTRMTWRGQPFRFTLATGAVVIVLSEVVMAATRWFPQVGHAAHLGGAAFGALAGCALRFYLPWRQRRLARADGVG